MKMNRKQYLNQFERRRRQVQSLLAKGKKQREIADELGVSQQAISKVIGKLRA